MIAYLDASAAAKLMMREAESESLRTVLGDAVTAGGTVTSSVLLETELRRAATRNGVDQLAVTAVLDLLDLTALQRDMFTAAGLLMGTALRTLDALHVIAALRTPADLFVSYDARQLDAARRAGLRVASPGAPSPEP